MCHTLFFQNYPRLNQYDCMFILPRIKGNVYRTKGSYNFLSNLL
jgi:hypothetical protein